MKARDARNKAASFEQTIKAKEAEITYLEKQLEDIAREAAAGRHSISTLKKRIAELEDDKDFLCQANGLRNEEQFAQYRRYSALARMLCESRNEEEKTELRTLAKIMSDLGHTTELEDKCLSLERANMLMDEKIAELEKQDDWVNHLQWRVQELLEALHRERRYRAWRASFLNFTYAFEQMQPTRKEELNAPVWNLDEDTVSEWFEDIADMVIEQRIENPYRNEFGDKRGAAFMISSPHPTREELLDIIERAKGHFQESLKRLIETDGVTNAEYETRKGINILAEAKQELEGKGKV